MACPCLANLLPSPPDAPWLSVLTPCHEGARWLDATLASVARQDCDGVEIIILDSSQGQDCAEIANRHAGTLNIRYEHRPEVVSWTGKTNLAAQAARAPHLAMLHQDDLWLPGRAESLRRQLATHPDAALLLSPAQIIDQNGRKLGLWRCPLPSGVVEGDLLVERLLVQNFVALPAPVFSRDAWIAAGGLDETLWYTPDWDLWLKLAALGPVVYHAEPSTAFRIHAGSLTVSGSRDRTGFAAQMTTVVDRHIGRIPAARRGAVLKAARASVTVNDSLAAAATTGTARELARACGAVLRLSPPQALRFWRDSRIADRLWPRVRARLAGAF